MRKPGPYGVRRVPFHFRSGIQYDYPICCVLHFCWDNMLGRAAGMTRWKQIRHKRSGLTCVPCGLFHDGGSTLSPPLRAWRILSFEWVFLLPTKQGKSRREIASRGAPSYQVSTVEERRQAINRGRQEESWWAEGSL